MLLLNIIKFLVSLPKKKRKRKGKKKKKDLASPTESLLGLNKL